MKRFDYSSGDGSTCEILIAIAKPERLLFSSELSVSDLASMPAMYKWPFRSLPMPAPHIRALDDLPSQNEDGTELWSRRSQLGALANWPTVFSESEAQILALTLGTNISGGDRLFPIGPLVRPRNLSQSYHRDDRLFINGGFFLCDHTEPRGPADAFGDPIGLLLTDGGIANPPVYKRAAFFVENGKVRFDYIGREDLIIELPDGTTVVPGAPSAVEFVAHGINGALGRTEASDAYEIAFQRSSAVYAKSGGDMAIPKAGFVLRWQTRPDDTLIEALRSGKSLVFSLRKHSEATAALQMGPMLLQDGKVVVSDTSFLDEEFLGHQINLPPEPFPTDAGASKAGRLAMAIDGSGLCHVIAVRGTSGTLNKEGRQRTAGLTLVELAECLRDLGFVSALNLDGGASTQLFLGSGAVVFESRHIGGRTEGSFERPVSNVIVCAV